MNVVGIRVKKKLKVLFWKHLQKKKARSLGKIGIYFGWK